jgi:hypothetical protein
VLLQPMLWVMVTLKLATAYWHKCVFHAVVKSDFPRDWEHGIRGNVGFHSRRRHMARSLCSDAIRSDCVGCALVQGSALVMTQSAENSRTLCFFQVGLRDFGAAERIAAADLSNGAVSRWRACQEKP